MRSTRQVTESRIAIKASPRGTRAGFAVLSDGDGGAVTITVLPKPWAVGPRRFTLPLHRGGQTTHVTMFELDTVEVPCAVGVREVLAQGLLDLGAGAVADVDDTSGGQLLERVRSGGFIGDGRRADDRGFEFLLSLMLLARRRRAALFSDGYSGYSAPSLLRLITQRLFVDEVGRVLERVRPTYREHVETLSFPRGRLSGGSLAVSLLTGAPAVESTFDELSTDTNVLRIVLAALRVVAAEPVPSLFASVVAPTRARAVAFARRLGSVTVIDSERALVAARRSVPTPLDWPWRPALDLATQVLAGKTVVPREGSVRTPRAASIYLHMEKWWEQCLAEALRTIADGGAVIEQAPVASPWSIPSAEGEPAGGWAGSNTPLNVDLMFALDGELILADAKYKIAERSLGAADGYQMFSYSHTARWPTSGDLTGSGVIFYPGRVPITGGRNRGHPRRRVLVRATEPRYELRLLDLPFPSPTDVGTDVAWRDYVRALGQAIRSGLTN